MWNLFKVNSKDTKNDIPDFVLMSLEFWKDVMNCSDVYIVDFEQINVGWESIRLIR